MMMGASEFADRYTNDDVDSFNLYLDKQIEKVNLPNKDIYFLRSKIIEMYGNTVKNNLSVQ